MPWTAASRAAGQSIQLGFRTGCECSSLFMPYMDPIDFAVTMYSCIYMIETITCYSVYSLDTGIN
jgi:hypothetical protein